MDIHSARSELRNPPRLAWLGMLAEFVVVVVASMLLAEFLVV